MLSLEAIADALPTVPDPPPALALAGDIATLTYPSAEAYAARVSDDVEALRSLSGLAIVESWTVERHEAAPIVHLRYAPSPIVEAPAPVHVPAAHKRR